MPLEVHLHSFKLERKSSADVSTLLLVTNYWQNTSWPRRCRLSWRNMILKGALHPRPGTIEYMGLNSGSITQRAVMTYGSN